MTEVLRSPNTPFCTQNPNSSSSEGNGIRVSTEEREELKRREKEREELSIIALLVAIFRKSLIACNTGRGDRISAANMDIGWPTNVRHVAHVTFDRFDGFLGLPDEFEPEVPRRAPSASTSVFGVSTRSMQLTYDSRGNCVPTILILMQRRLYSQRGLQEEGIFRITGENGQEEFIRGQLNTGIIPNDIDVHCLAGLIKAWFRELPSGVLDPLSSEDVMRCESEEDCTELVRELPLTEAALLDWAINLMADVVQEEDYNKMNAYNIAMVFAPNMTQMVDPLTALMYAVQVINFLKTLITKRLRDREESRIDPPPASCAGPPDESGHQSPSSQPCQEEDEGTEEESAPPFNDSPLEHSTQFEDGDDSDDSPFHWQSFRGLPTVRTGSRFGNDKCGQSRDEFQDVVGPTEKPKSMSNLSCINTRIDRVEAWR